jgi:acetyltransferase-like isoleucine patch superfamily enzyme
VVLHDGTRLGEEVRVDDNAVIGKQPMRSVRSALPDVGEQAPAIVGDRSIVGTGAVLYAGCRLHEDVLVADLATVRENVSVGSKTIVGRGVAIESHCSIGEFCKLETNAYITAYSVIEDHVFVAPGVLTSNDRFIGRTEERFSSFRGVHARRGSRLAVGSVILPGIDLAEESVAAAGAVVVKSTEKATIYAGVPARPLKHVPAEQILPDEQDGQS